VNTRTTVITVAIATAMACAVWILETNNSVTTPKPHNVATGSPLLETDTLPPDAVEQITITRQGQPAWKLIRRGRDHWEQTEPVRFPLSAYACRSLVRETLALQTTGVVESTKVEELGLAPPRATIRFSGSKMPSDVVIDLGKQPGVGHGYVRVDGKTIYTVNDQMHKILMDDRLKEVLRSKLPVQFEAGLVQRAVLHRGASSIRFEHKDDQWILIDDKGRSDRADPKVITRLLNTVGQFAIWSFTEDAPPNPSVYGLDKPTAVLNVTLTDGTSHRLAIGGPASLDRRAFYATIDENQVVVTTKVAGVAPLLLETNQYRDPRQFGMASTSVNKITVHAAGGKPIVFEQAGNIWKFAQPAPKFKLDARLFSELRQRLFLQRTWSYPTERPAGDPTVVITARTSGDAPPAQLRLWDLGKDKHWVGFLDNATVGRHLRSVDAGLFTEPIEGFRDRTVLGISLKQLLQVVVQRSGDQAATHTIERVGKEWSFDNLDPAAVQKLLTHLVPLRAASWSVPIKPNENELTIQFKIQTRTGPRTRTLQVSRNGVARFSGLADPFFLSRPLTEALDTELTSKVILPISLRELAVVITQGHAIERTPRRRYKLHTPGALKFEGRIAAKLFDTLANLTVDQYRSHVVHPANALRLMVVSRAGTSVELFIWKDAQGVPLGIVRHFDRTPDLITGTFPSPAKPVSTKGFSLDTNVYDALRANPATTAP
jgi:hypothetical protein